MDGLRIFEHNRRRGNRDGRVVEVVKNLDRRVEKREKATEVERLTTKKFCDGLLVFGNNELDEEV